MGTSVVSHSSHAAPMSGKEVYVSVLRLASSSATGQSFRSADHPVFRAQLRAAGSTIPSSDDGELRAVTLNLLYDAVVAYQARQLQKATSCSVTFDLWTSEGLKHALVSITYHWSHQFQRHSAVLDAVPLHHPDAARNLALALARRIDGRVNEDQLMYLGAAGNASYVTKAAKLLVSKYEELLKAVEQGGEKEDDDAASNVAAVEVKRAFDALLTRSTWQSETCCHRRQKATTSSWMSFGRCRP